MRRIRTQADWLALEAFANSFGHSVIGSEKDESVPMFAFDRGDQTRGYTQLHKNTPIAFAGWHTDKMICTPRDVIDGMNHIKGWAKVERGGGLLAIPMGSENFTPEIMERLDFKRLHMEIYQTGDK